MPTLAKDFGVAKSTIFRVVHSESKGGWRHVP